MGKIWLWISLIALVVAGVGTHYAANSSLFWLASGSSLYQEIRLGLALLVGLQLMTSPPRHVAFRIIAGACAVWVGIWAIQQTYDYHMALLDSCVFIGSSILIFATALERNVLEEARLYKEQNGHKQLKANF